MSDAAVLTQILTTLADLQASQNLLSQKVDKIQAESEHHPHGVKLHIHDNHYSGHSDSDHDTVVSPTFAPKMDHESLFAGKPILLSHPDQLGVKPYNMNWGDADPQVRGPIIVSRHSSSINIRNALGAYGGPYSIYRALAVAMEELVEDHQPNFDHTEPVINVPQQPQWSDPTKIVSFDPFGHMASHFYEKEIKQGLDIRPTIAITRAHMLVPEIQAEVRSGALAVDCKVVITNAGELNVHKAAIDPVWFLPGVAARLNVEEDILRRCLFESTGGMYPELISRPDIKVFLPPIGGLTVYIFGNHELLSDPKSRLTVRVHDECNGSDVFCSDICTCRPYLIFGMVEAIKEAQNGGVGLIIYCKLNYCAPPKFALYCCCPVDPNSIYCLLGKNNIVRKEGRALGEVTKYLVYNARKRVGDSAAKYFERTENVAGVKDMRFQGLMPDVLHWLGITKIDRFMSMSNMKHDAIVDAGIQILERVPIPDELIPADSKVEIDAKIAAGYFTNGHIPDAEDLSRTVGRGWNDSHP